MPLYKFLGIRISRTTALSSATTAARLAETLSEAVNFGPTKAAARIIQQMLETVKEVDDNDESCRRLIRKATDFLILIREHYEESSAILIVSPNFSKKMREFEHVLLEINEDISTSIKRMGRVNRMISRDRIRGELAAHSAELDLAIEKIKFSLLLGIAVATHTVAPTHRNLQYDDSYTPSNWRRPTAMKPLVDRVFLIQADITTLKVDAIVNAANESLSGGSYDSVDGAIHHAAGPELLHECRRLVGCATGDAKITGAYKLPARYVIHAVGPVYYERFAAQASNQLTSCYFRSLELAVQNKIRKIAFPAISTGTNRYPIEDGIRIALGTTRQFLLSPDGDEIDLVIFTMFSKREQLVYKRLIPEYFSNSS